MDRTSTQQNRRSIHCETYNENLGKVTLTLTSGRVLVIGATGVVSVGLFYNVKQVCVRKQRREPRRMPAL
jgi:hypothetical protein